MTQTGAIEISGNTYPWAASLKRLGLTWDVARRVWVGVPTTEIKSITSYFGRRAGRDLTMRPVATATPSPALCPTCGTYCYGDCTAR